MKIGIITFHAAHNYGSMLQAYALQTFLERNGNIVEIIKPIMHHEEDENNIFIRESDNGTLLEVLLNQSNIISKLLCKEKD